MKPAEQWLAEFGLPPGKSSVFVSRDEIRAIQADALQHAAITAWGQKVPMNRNGSWSWNMACEQAHRAIVGEVPRV